MAAIIPGNSGNLLGTGAGGDGCGADGPLIVPLTGTLTHLVPQYFQTQGPDDARVSEQFIHRTVWYGIVDGNVPHGAIQMLKQTGDHWNSFRWYVTAVNGGNLEERYRQLGSM